MDASSTAFIVSSTAQIANDVGVTNVILIIIVALLGLDFIRRFVMPNKK